METVTLPQNIASLVEAVKRVFTDFLKEQVDVKVNDMLEAFENDEVQAKLIDAVQNNIKSKSKSKTLKDPNAPRRPKSAYVFFCQDKREKVKASHPDLKAPQISKKLGELWRAVSESDKAKYTQLAEKAKEEYKVAMNDYTPPSEDELVALNKAKGKGKGKGKGKSKAKATKDPNAPKRPVTAFMLFSQEKRNEVKRDHPEMKGSEISKELGRLWKEDFADEESREKWVTEAEKDKERYKQEMEAYKSDSENAEESKTQTQSKSQSKTQSKTQKKSQPVDSSDSEDDEKPQKKPQKKKSQPVDSSDSEDDEKPQKKPQKKKILRKKPQRKLVESSDSEDE